MTAVVCSPDATVLKAVVGTLKQRGFHVHHTVRGLHAVRLCRKYRPDLVVLDEALAEPCAAAVIAEVSNDPDTREAKFVFLDRDDLGSW